jgi:hypothetical protein
VLLGGQRSDEEGWFHTLSTAAILQRISPDFAIGRRSGAVTAAFEARAGVELPIKHGRSEDSSWKGTMMAARGKRMQGLGWLMVAAFTVLAAGCGGTGGARRGGMGVDDGLIPHSAYRPAFDGAPGKTFFLGGYAGYNYGPVGRRSNLPTRRGGDTWGYPVVDGALDLGAPQP